MAEPVFIVQSDTSTTALLYPSRTNQWRISKDREPPTKVIFLFCMRIRPMAYSQETKMDRLHSCLNVNTSEPLTVFRNGLRLGHCHQSKTLMVAYFLHIGILPRAFHEGIDFRLRAARGSSEITRSLHGNKWNECLSALSGRRGAVNACVTRFS